jgi:tryptophanyl-tRNA synthetase
MKKILVSGVKPTGRPHIANYFGAMKQFVDLQDSHESYVFVANYHALNQVHDAATLSQDTLDVVLDYLAIGLDPETTTLYVQSDVPQVTELTWIFNTLVTVPYMERAHAFKDAVAKGMGASVGLFDYPVLMAADILLPGAHVVPVGQDQKQHVEYARDIAGKFNNAFGETFALPEAMILENVATIPGTDGQKMSKSYGNTIPLFATREEITKAVMSIVTDSSGEIPKNVYAIHKLFKPESELVELYEANKGSYKVLKEALIEDIDAFIAPMRERRAELAKDPDAVRSMLKEHGEAMRTKAEARMKEIRKACGIGY